MKKLYFAYGSNLSASDWRRYCDERTLSPEGLTFQRSAWLPDWEVSFHYYSKNRQGGALTIHRQPGTAVPGALFEADEETWNILDRKEGVAAGCYEPIEVVALDEEGMEWACTTYEVTKSSRAHDPIPPAPGYHEIVSAALQELGLPTDQLDAAARGDDPELLPAGLFTYGTLLRGESRWGAAEAIAAGDVVEGTCPGALVDLLEYPGLLNAKDTEETTGEIVPLSKNRSGSAGWVESIDAIEDFQGYGNPDSLYRRIVRRTKGTAAEGHVWTYLYLGATAGLPHIAGNDWRKRGN